MSSSQYGNEPPENQSVDQTQDTGDQANQYEHGPSFAGDEHPPEHMPQTPAWLQTFAATVGDPSDGSDQQDSEIETHREHAVAVEQEQPESSPVEPEPEPADEPEPVDTSGDAQSNTPSEVSTEVPRESTESSEDVGLPDWLEQPREHPAAEEPSTEAPSTQESYSASSLINEDDLPDWLKAIGSEDTGDADVAAAATPTDQTSNAVFRVPAISRAWITGQEMRQLTEGASVFQHVTAEEGHSALPGVSEAGAAQAGAAQVASDASAGAQVSDEGSQSIGDRFGFKQIALVVLLVVLVLLVILMFL